MKSLHFYKKNRVLVSNTMGLLKNEMSEKFSKIASIGSKKHDERVELTSATRPKVRKCLIIMQLISTSSDPFQNFNCLNLN